MHRRCCRIDHPVPATGWVPTTRYPTRCRALSTEQCVSFHPPSFPSALKGTRHQPPTSSMCQAYTAYTAASAITPRRPDSSTGAACSARTRATCASSHCRSSWAQASTTRLQAATTCDNNSSGGGGGACGAGVWEAWSGPALCFYVKKQYLGLAGPPRTSQGHRSAQAPAHWRAVPALFGVPPARANVKQGAKKEDCGLKKHDKTGR